MIIYYRLLTFFWKDADPGIAEVEDARERDRGDLVSEVFIKLALWALKGC